MAAAGEGEELGYKEEGAVGALLLVLLLVLKSLVPLSPDVGG
jgi:hypothetical protein